MTSADEHKRAAALVAVDELPDEGLIGLGTGSTVRFFLEALAARVEQGHRYVAVPTSSETRTRASALGIPLADDEGPWDVLVNVDGADEVDPARNVLKGGGGALLREKIVNRASRRNVVVVDESKLVPVLGRRAVPIEVLPFGHRATARALEAFGTPTLRAGRSDNGNLLYDLRTSAIDDPDALERALHAIPGVVEVGLFLHRVDLVLVAGATGVRRL